MNATTVSSPAAPLTDDDFQTLEDILDHMEERLGDLAPEWEFCDGYATAIACTRREVSPEEYMSALFGAPDEEPAAFVDADERARFLSLWQRRAAEIAASLAAPVESIEDERMLAPYVQDMRALVASLSPEDQAEWRQSAGEIPPFGRLWAEGFFYAVDCFAEDWEPPRDREAAEAIADALDCLRALLEDDTAPVIEAEPGSLAEGETPPMMSAERLNVWGEALWAVYDLADIWHTLGPRVSPARRAVEPGRNDLCPCGSGLKYKKCHGAPGRGGWPAQN